MQEFNQKDITLALSGDRDAVTRLVFQLRTPVFGLALLRLGNYHDAEDITHEAIMKIFGRLTTYNPSYSFTGWAMSITANCCTDFLRRRREIPSGDDWLPDSIIKSEGPEEQMLRDEKRAFLIEHLKELSPEERLVIFLRYYQGLNYEDIAKATGMNKATVGTRLFRAKKFLLARLKKEPGQDWGTD